MKLFNAFDYFIKERNIDKGNGKNLMIISKHERITYEDFFISVTEKYKTVFEELKFSKRIGIIIADSIIQQIVYWGCLKNGVVPALFNYNENVDSVINIIEKAKIDSVVIASEKVELLEMINSKCKLKRLFTVEKNGTIKLFYSDVSRDITEKEYKFILFSSGTTGISKGIIHSQTDMKYAAQTYGEQILKLSNKDVVYSMASLNYGFAFTNSTFQSVYGCATVIIDSNTDIWEIYDNIRTFHPTVLCGVPAIYDSMAELANDKIEMFSSVRLALSSGEKLSSQLWDTWNGKYNIPIIEGYGSVEMLTNVISNSLENYQKGSSGLLLEGYDCKVEFLNSVDKSKGVIIITGGSVSNESIISDEKGSKTYNTNDIFTIDKDGFFWYNGRLDNVYKVNGTWFNPLELEEYIEKFDNIKTAVVINDNMNLTAYLIVSEDEIVDQTFIKELNNYLKQEKKQFICPNNYIVVKKIPRNANGKKLRIIVEQKYIIKSIKV